MSISNFITSHILDLNYNFILGLSLVVVFIAVWFRRSLAAIASLSAIATYYILSQGSSFINSWLMTSSNGLRNIQLTAALRLVAVVALPIFILFVLKRLGRHQPIIIRTLSAACLSCLLVWYVALELTTNAMIVSISTTPIYMKIHQLYPILLLSALTLSAFELWFIRKHDNPKVIKKSKH